MSFRPAAPAAVRLAVVDSDSGFVRVLAKRLGAVGWRAQLLADAAARSRSSRPCGCTPIVIDTALLAADGVDLPRAALRSAGRAGGGRLHRAERVAQRVRGLRLGADDWVTKPCHPEEVLARVEAAVRRRRAGELAAQPVEPIVAGELEIRPDMFEAFVGGPRGRPDAPRVRAASPARRRDAAGSCRASASTSACGATRWRTATARWTSSCASCARSSRTPRRAGSTCTRTSASATASTLRRRTREERPHGRPRRRSRLMAHRSRGSTPPQRPRVLQPVRRGRREHAARRRAARPAAPDAGPTSSGLGREILICEQEGDRITHDLIQLLNRKVSTPIDRRGRLRAGLGARRRRRLHRGGGRLPRRSTTSRRRWSRRSS